ncbi:MAG: microcystin-dependent protein [Polaribacter sp.]|jgi:microcystin-dependent protein
MEPMMAQIMIFGGNFAPRGWAFCDGQLLAISQNTALFSLLGTTYGGDGRTTFALPDLRGRVAVHPGNGPGLTPRKLGQRSGVETETLTLLQMPIHTHITSNTPSTDQHVSLSSTLAVNEIPQPNDVPAVANYPAPSGLGETKVKSFGPATASNTVNGQTISGSAGLTVHDNGGNQPHNNMQPWLGLNYIIALQGIYPSRS